MIPKRSFILLFTMIYFLATSAWVQSQPAGWKSLHMNVWPAAYSSDTGMFHFVVVGDRTGHHRDSVFYRALHQINLLQPEFVTGVGDIIEGYSEDPAVIDEEWKGMETMTSELSMPFYFVPGNHDYSNEVQAKAWAAHFGPSYSHFIRHNVLFLFLNTEEMLGGSGKGAIGEPQYEYVRDVLEKTDNVRWTFVFMHQPLWHEENTGYWADIKSLLSSRRYTIFAGHEHHYQVADWENGKAVIMATTGGFSELKGLEEGEFDHIMWVTFSGGEPVFLNLMLDGIYGLDVHDAGE